MARKKKEYYDLKKLIDPSGLARLNEAYEKWENSGNSEPLKSVYEEIMGFKMEDDKEELKEKDLIENKDLAKVQKLNQEIKERSSKQLESTQNLVEELEKEIMETTKFDWQKYLDENPKFKGKDSKSGAEVLLLQFFKDLAHFEGFSSIRYLPLGNADQGYCGVSCEVVWRNGQLTSGLADAHFNNCKSFTKYYLSALAQNRSFIRAVKEYFNIPILGQDEIGNTPEEEDLKEDAPTGPYVTLKKVAKDCLGITSFDSFKSLLRKQVKEEPKTAWLKPEEYQDWADYNDWGQIKKSKILELIGLIKK